MILDQLDNSSRYLPLHKSFEKAFAFLKQPGLMNLEEGKYEIDGTDIFAIVAKGPAKNLDEAKLEAHDAYIDIQYLAAGDESIGWAPRQVLRKLAEHRENLDLLFFDDDAQAMIPLSVGDFMIFFPEDGHMPMIGEGELHKVIIKVKC